MTDWPVKTLGDVCEIYQPQTIGLKDMMSDGPYVVYGANGPIGRYDRFNHENSEVTVTCRGATCGTVNVTPPQVWITGNAMVVRPNEAEMSKLLLKYWLEGLDYSSVITGAAQPQITRTTLSPMKIPVPPLEEQKRIVELLDAATAHVTELTACYEQARTHAGLLGGSILVNQLTGVIGSKTIKLGDLAELKGRIGWRGLTAKEYTKEGPLFVSVHSLNYGHFVNLKDAFHITQERYDESPEIMLEDHDILICKDGAGIGKLGIVGQLPGPATINSSLLLIRASERVRSEFLYFYLLSPIFQNLVQERLSGSTTPHLYQRDIAELEIELPSLETQDLLIERMWRALKKQDELIECFSKQIEAASQIRQSILESAFAGDL